MIQAVTKATPFLKVEEQFRRHPYEDAKDSLAVGYGLNLTFEGLDEDEAAWLLQSKLKKRFAALSDYPWFAALSAGKQAAILELSYQIGVRGLLRFKKAIAAMAVRDYETAAAELLDSRWAKAQTPDRASRVVARFRAG